MFLRLLPRLIGVDGGILPDGDAALETANPELNNPHVAAGPAQPQAEAGQILVEDNPFFELVAAAQVILERRDGVGDGILVDLHGRTL
jgi:hypothetical protein